MTRGGGPVSSLPSMWCRATGWAGTQAKPGRSLVCSGRTLVTPEPTGEVSGGALTWVRLPHPRFTHHDQAWGHGARFEAEEAALSADIVDRCAAVHILARGTPELVAGWFTIPADKILEVPHPSYAGAYEDFITREQARHELGLWPDETTGNRVPSAATSPARSSMPC